MSGTVEQPEQTLLFCLPFILTLYLASCRQVNSCPAPADVSANTVLLCRACGHELVKGADIHPVLSQLALSSRNHTMGGDRLVPVQLFENPHGLRFEVITVRKANATLHWPADKRFSWYPGFSWIMATCHQCRTHLGWAFQPSDWPETVPKSRFQESEQTFLAFITNRLLTEDFASSLLITPKSFTG